MEKGGGCRLFFIGEFKVIMEEQKTTKLNFYKVDKEFLSYLHNEDEKANDFSCVPTMDYSAKQKEKFMCGVVLKVGNYDYFAPVSSYAKKQKDNILLFDNEENPTSSIRLNFMFPVPKDMREIYNFEEETDERYKSVVRRELKSANEQRESIQKQAKRTYYIVRNLIAQDKAPQWACNFTFLEKLCQEWEKNKSNERQAEPAQQAEPARQVGQVGQAEQAGQAERKNTKEKLTAEDEAVIERIRSSRRGTEFETLWRGEPLTDDPKRDEFQLMNYLAFFTKCNKAQMQRIFQHSGLYHPERGQSYLDRITDKAVTTLNMRLSDRAGQGRTNSRGNGGYKGK